MQFQDPLKLAIALYQFSVRRVLRTPFLTISLNRCFFYTRYRRATNVAACGRNAFLRSAFFSISRRVCIGVLQVQSSTQRSVTGYCGGSSVGQLKSSAGLIFLEFDQRQFAGFDQIKRFASILSFSSSDPLICPPLQLVVLEAEGAITVWNVDDGERVFTFSDPLNK